MKWRMSNINEFITITSHSIFSQGLFKVLGGNHILKVTIITKLDLTESDEQSLWPFLEESSTN